MGSWAARPCSSANNTRDGHGKVLTSKGPKDRRIWLSFETALKFYDIHHRLGFSQPTKSVEWLLHHAQPAIEELSLQAYPPTLDHHKSEAEEATVPPALAWFDDQCIWSASSHMNVGIPSQEEQQQSRSDESQRRQKLDKKDFYSKHTAHMGESEAGWRESMQSKEMAVDRRAKARERARERTMHKNNNLTSLYCGHRRATSEFCESGGENLQHRQGLVFPHTLGISHIQPHNHSNVYSDQTFYHSNGMMSSLVLSGFSNTCYDLEPSTLELDNGFYNQ